MGAFSVFDRLAAVGLMPAIVAIALNWETVGTTTTPFTCGKDPNWSIASVRSVQMISQKAKYALKAVLALARAESGQLSISEIAERESIPKKFLEQILLDLKHHGIVSSRRGKAGGYTLLKPSETITLGEILRIVDGPVAPLPCLSRMAYRRCEDCRSEENCEVRRAFAEVANASRLLLDRTTIFGIMSGDPQTSLPAIAV